MKETEFVIYEKFSHQEDILELAHLLDSNNIIYLIEEDAYSFDPSFANNDYQKDFILKLQKKDFEKVEAIQIEIYNHLTEDVEKDYYLFRFSDEKLMEIIIKKDEWGKFDFVLAQKILKERGKEINDEKLEDFKKQRIKELSKNDNISQGWIIMSYFLAFFSGILGILIGGHIINHKKTLPNGEKVYGYSEKDRRNGKIIMVIGIIVFGIFSLLRLILFFSKL